MAVLSATIQGVHTIKADAVTGLQIAEILFTITGTYVQADGAKVASVATEIQNSRRNGKSVTLVSTMLSQPGSKASDGTLMALSTPTISTADITFADITDGDYTTELTAGAVPAMSRPFAIQVAFTEA